MSKKKVDTSLIGSFRYEAGGNVMNIQQYVLQNTKNPQRAKSYGWKTLSKTEITGVPFTETTTKEMRTKSWLGNGMQQDDINCYSEYEVTITKKNYDAILIKKFAQECASKISIKL